MDMTEIYSPRFWQLFEKLDVSLTPQGPDQLHDIARGFLPSRARILDVGCRDAGHLLRLVHATGGTGFGIDPVPWHIQRASQLVAGEGLCSRVHLARAVAEAIPTGDAAFDLVWYRDVVEVLPDLASAMREMNRVLRPGGHLVIYTNVLNGTLDDRENAAIHLPLGNVPGNLVKVDLEASFATHGFTTVLEWTVGTEWREHLEERDGVVSRDLLRLARLRRRREAVVKEYGRAAFQTAEASLQWSVYQFLGRFVPMIYVLQKPPQDRLTSFPADEMISD